MKYGIFLGILNLILLARLRLLLKDEVLEWEDLLFIGGIPLLVLPFLQVNVGWFLLLIYLLVWPLFMRMMEKDAEPPNRNRGLMMLINILVVGLLCSPLTNLAANNLPVELLSLFNHFMLPNSSIGVGTVISIFVVLFGLLLVLNEMNFLLRYILQLTGLKSLGEEGEEVDQGEYNTGRLIGLLERIFVFIFVLLSQYTAIGFILAAKGVARFQDFKSRTFAEYVLIGTLLSTLLAMAVAYAVMLMM